MHMKYLSAVIAIFCLRHVTDRRNIPPEVLIEVDGGFDDVLHLTQGRSV